jgi:hypothetical protein
MPIWSEFSDGTVPNITYDSTPENHDVPGPNPGLATS